MRIIAGEWRRRQLRAPPGGIALGGDQAGGLVEAVEPRRLGLGDRLFVDRHPAQIRQDRSGRLDFRPVQRHAPLGDHPLDLAPAGDAGAGEQLGDPLAFGFGGFGHGRALAAMAARVSP